MKLEINSRADFAKGLTELRERAGLTIREVARATGLQASTVGGYYSGRHLPPLQPSSALADILRVCGVSDPEEVRAWEEKLRQLRRSPGPRPANAPEPYRGLASYQPEDANWFFGRESLTEAVVRRVTDRKSERTLLLVVGPSGAGKSSLLRAGVIATLEDLGISWQLLTPGQHPTQSWLTSNGQTGSNHSAPSVVVIDQFEELFTVCNDEVERRSFVAAISALADTGQTSVLIGLRADFYSQALNYPQLVGVAQDHQIVVGPMSGSELRVAIEQPARVAKVDLESGLVELFLRDLTASAGADSYEAGALPLLSHALFATWEHGRGRRMTVFDYAAIGGLYGAVARSAERVYLSLDPADCAIARDLFIGLVVVGGDRPDTRGRIPIAELVEQAGAAEVASRFVDERLLTTDQDSIQISHEALIRAWPRLRRWIEDSRSALAVAQQIRDAAERWDRQSRDPAALYRGAQLAVAEQWATQPGHGGQTHLASDFLVASRRYERRRVVRLYQTVVSLALLLVVAVGATTVAMHKGAEANQQRNEAISRLGASWANRLRSRDVGLAAQLSLAAYRISPTTEARSSLLDVSAMPKVTRLLGGPGVMQSVAVSPDGQALAAGGLDKRIHTWDISDSSHPRSLTTPLQGPTDTVFAIAFSPDGKVLAAAGGDKKVHLWDMGDRHHPVPRAALSGPTAVVYSLAFSPDGRTLAAGSGDASVYLWDIGIDQLTPLTPPLVGATDHIQSVAFSSDGNLLAGGSADRNVWLWNVSDRRTPRLLAGPIVGPKREVYSVAFSPDGKSLVAGSSDHYVYPWDLTNPEAPVAREPIAAGTGWINSLAFSQDGRNLAMASSSNEVLLWDIAAKRSLGALPHPGPVTAVAYIDAGTLVTSASDGTARIWHLPLPALAGHGNVISGVAFGPKGNVLAIASGETQLWNVVDRSVFSRTMTNEANFSTAIAFTRDGKELAIGSSDGTIQLWDVSDVHAPSKRGPPIKAHSELIESLAFSVDGKILASGGDDFMLRLWDTTDAANPRPLATLEPFANYVFSVAFSPDGKVLAAASIDKTMRLWNIRNPNQPAAFGPAIQVSDHYALAVAFSPDSQTLAVGSADKSIHLFDVAQPARPIRLGQPLPGPSNYVYSLAFALNGRTLAAGSTDGAIWLWDIENRNTPAVWATLTVPSTAIYSVAYHPDGHTLVAGGADKVAWLWETDPALVADQICGIAGDPITEMEWHQYLPDAAYEPPCQ